MLTCVGWQVTLCDPIRQVTLRSSVMDLSIKSYTFLYLYLLYNKLSTTSTQQNENMTAIGSQPIRAHHSSHVHESFLYGIELCCIRCKKLVQEKSCTRNHVRRSSFLSKLTCTSFLYAYKFLDCVSPPLPIRLSAGRLLTRKQKNA